MAGMMMNHPNMATLMGQMGGMPDGNLAAQPLQDDDDVDDEGPHNTGSSSAHQWLRVSQELLLRQCQLSLRFLLCQHLAFLMMNLCMSA
jgi:hypothetical protein